MSERDIEGDYRRAYIEEYEGYRRGGRDEEAEHIAELLRAHYGHEVEPQDDDGQDDDEEPGLETSAADAPPENTAAPRPRRPRQPKASQ